MKEQNIKDKFYKNNWFSSYISSRFSPSNKNDEKIKIENKDGKVYYKINEKDDENELLQSRTQSSSQSNVPPVNNETLTFAACSSENSSYHNENENKNNLNNRHGSMNDSINMTRPFKVNNENNNNNNNDNNNKINQVGVDSDSGDEEYDFAPRFIRDNLCYQCSLNPVWYLTLAWRCAQFASFCVIGVGFYLCV